METYIIIILIFGIITLLLLCLLFFINRLTLIGMQVENKFIPIKEQIEERINILEQFSKYITNNFKYEKDLIKEIQKNKESLIQITKASNGLDNLYISEDLFKKLLTLDETYPKIKNNKDYLELVEKYNETKNKIDYSKEDYNKEVQKYNHYKENKIISTLDKIIHFPNYDDYKN